MPLPTKAAATEGPVKEKDRSQGREGGGGAAVRAKEEEEAPIVLKRRSTTPFMRGAARGGRPYSDAKPSTATPTLRHAAIPLLPHRRAVASASSTPGRVRLLDPKQIPVSKPKPLDQPPRRGPDSLGVPSVRERVAPWSSWRRPSSRAVRHGTCRRPTVLLCYAVRQPCR